MTIETVAGMTDLQIKLFTAVGQILVATAVGFIALRQWLTARNKLKADLFDRRFALVKELRRRVNAIRAAQIKAEDFLTLPDLARETGFLFNKKVRDASDRLVDNLTTYHRQQALINDSFGTHATQQRAVLDLLNAPHEERGVSVEQIQLQLKDTEGMINQLATAMEDQRKAVSWHLKDLEAMTSSFLTLKH